MDDMIAADRSRRGDRAILWRSREQCARVVRSQAVGIDEFIARWVARSPALLHQPARPPDRSAGRGPIMTAFSGCGSARTPAAAQESLQGRYAAFASSGSPPTPWTQPPAPWFSCSPWPPSRSPSASSRASRSAGTGTTHGLALPTWRGCSSISPIPGQPAARPSAWRCSGVRVVRSDGADSGARRAVVRTLALPLSFLIFGLGFVGILLGRRRRALHERHRRHGCPLLLGRAGRQAPVPVPHHHITCGRPRRRSCLTGRGLIRPG